MNIKRGLVLGAFALLLVTIGAPARAEEKAAGAPAKAECHMTFAITGWAVVYQSANGTGTITCDNGQKAEVKVTMKSAGLTAGRYHIDGKGDFSKVHDISELFGGYAAAEGNAGIIKSGEAAVVTKGEVTLGLAGHGEGWNIGVSVGKFTITKEK